MIETTNSLAIRGMTLDSQDGRRVIGTTYQRAWTTRRRSMNESSGRVQAVVPEVRLTELERCTQTELDLPDGLHDEWVDGFDP